MSASKIAVSGVFSVGLQTMRLFVAIAGAIELYDQALVLAPGDVRIEAARAMALSRKVYYDSEQPQAQVDATAAVESLLARRPELAEVQIAAGHVKLHHGDPIAAAQHLRRAIAGAPYLAEAHEWLGRMLLEAAHLDEGRARLETALALDPRLELARWEIARAHALEGDWDEYDRVARELIGVARMRATPWTARFAAWRGDLRTFAEIASASQVVLDTGLGRKLTEALIALVKDRDWATRGAELVELAIVAPTSSSRRRSLMCQLAAEMAGQFGDTAAIGRLVDHAVTEGFFDPLEGEVFPDSIRELSYSGIPIESYFINVTDPTAKLAEIGEWVPTVAGTYSGLCTYCGKNKELFFDYYPEDFNEAGCSLGTSSEPRCCQGKCPPEALVLEVPYYAQCSFSNRGSTHKPCAAGCGPTSVKMAFEAAGLGVLDIYGTWDALWTSASAGTDRARIKSYAQTKGIFVADGADMQWDALQEHILQGHPIIFNPTQEYNDERYCYGLSSCPTGGHYFVVVGISPETLIINEPYPWWSPVSFSSGNNLVLRKETIQRLYAVSGRVYYIVINPKVDLRPETAEPPEEGLPEDVTPPAGVSET